MLHYFGPGSLVGTPPYYGLVGPVSNPGWRRDFPTAQTGPGAHPASCKMSAVSFPGVKCGRSVLLTTHPLSSAAVMEEYSYNSTHPLGHTEPVTGSLFCTPLYSTHTTVAAKCTIFSTFSSHILLYTFRQFIDILLSYRSINSTQSHIHVHT